MIHDGRVEFRFTLVFRVAIVGLSRDGVLGVTHLIVPSRSELDAAYETSRDAPRPRGCWHYVTDHLVLEHDWEGYNYISKHSGRFPRFALSRVRPEGIIHIDHIRLVLSDDDDWDRHPVGGLVMRDGQGTITMYELKHGQYETYDRIEQAS